MVAFASNPNISSDIDGSKRVFSQTEKGPSDFAGPNTGKDNYRNHPQ